MRSTVVALLCALSFGASADVTITGAYPSDRAGKQTAPQVGKPFFLTVTLNVSRQAAPYHLTVDSPARQLDSGLVSYGVGNSGAYWMRQGEIVPLFDGPMDITVACSAAKKPFKLRIIPAASKEAISYYAPQRLSASYGAAVEFDRIASGALAWIPEPQSEGAQVVEVTEEPAKQALTKEWQQPIGLVESSTGLLEGSAACRSISSSVGTNLTLLRAVPMSAVAFTPWLLPEARIQSTHKEIVAFARKATKGMGAKTPVVDVALAVYSAVLKQSSYQETDALPDALQALRTGKGECGDLSALFVAACRAAGVPARTVSGFTLGNDAWHVWAEFSVPGMGWVPVDPAYAASLRPRSAYPLYFGVVPELRDRVALCRGFSHSLGGGYTTFLQTPQFFASEKDVKVRSALFWSRLAVEATGP